MANPPKILLFANREIENGDLLKKLQELNVNELDIEDVFSDNQLSKIEFRKDYLYTLIQFPEYEKNTKTFVEKEVHCFLNKDIFWIIDKNNYKPIHTFLTKRNLADIEYSTTFDLLYEMIWHGLVRCYEAMIKLKQEVQTLNREIFQEDVNKDLVFDIQTVKKNIVNLNAIIEPIVEVMMDIEHKSHKLFDAEDKEEVDDCLDLTKKIISNLSNLKDRMMIISETHEAIMVRKTNQAVNALTGISVLAIFPTFITSFFGMNLYFFGLEDSSIGLIFVVTSIAIITALTFYILYKKKWL